MALPNHDKNIAKIFHSLAPTTLALSTRESGTVEFKQSFDWGNKGKYAKTMAAFANNRGGYLIFGVTNSPRMLVGLNTENFESHDEAEISAYLNGIFSPEIRYEKLSREIAGKRIGILYVHQNEMRPVVSIKNGENIKEAEIYYRYNASSDKVKYPELVFLIELARERERKSWMSLFERVSKIGPENTGVMDLVNGTIEGSGGNLLIDAELIPKLKFIKEGNFVPAGQPVLKLVGDVQPITAPVVSRPGRAIRITSDPSAPAVREETVLALFPLNHATLIRALRKRYSDFKQTQAFQKKKRVLKENLAYCHTRPLDPQKPKGTRKDFYSLDILKEFDSLFTTRPTKNS